MTRICGYRLIDGSVAWIRHRLKINGSTYFCGVEPEKAPPKRGSSDQGKRDRKKIGKNDPARRNQNGPAKFLYGFGLSDWWKVSICRDEPLLPEEKPR